MRLLFFDIDGTLASGKEVPASAAKGIEEVRKNGDLVFICTGRNINYVRNSFHPYADGFITNNGRLAYYRDRCIFEKPIEKGTMNQLLAIVKNVNCGAIFHSKKKGYYVGPKDLYETIGIVSNPGYIQIGLDGRELDYYNFDIFFYDFEQCKQINEALKELCILNPHGPHPSADMTVKGCDKGDALAAVAGYLGVPIEDTYAFGDGLNDITMLEKAGHGIAMGNAMAETRKAAEFVTKNIDEDGVYHALLHYGFVREEL